MGKEKEPEVEIVDPEPEEDKNTPSEVVIDLNAPPKAEEPTKPKPSEDLSKLHNTIAYQTRKLDQAMRELQQVRAQLAAQPPVVEKVGEVDEIDEIAQKDWKQGVKKVVEKDIETRIQEAFQKREQAVQDYQRKVALESELDKSRQRVLSKYPNIEDETTEEAGIYRLVCNEDQTLYSNIHGPEIAMYRMEERMRQMGKTPATIQPLVNKEVNRLVRAGASSVVGRTASPSGKITLTKEQKEFCDHHNIPYDQYAKNLKAQEANGGVNP